MTMRLFVIGMDANNQSLPLDGRYTYKLVVASDEDAARKFADGIPIKEIPMDEGVIGDFLEPTDYSE